jgi:DNA-binding transcriptional ArsR family regulator
VQAGVDPEVAASACATRMPRLVGTSGPEGSGAVRSTPSMGWPERNRALSRLRYSAPIGAVSATLDRTFFALADPTRRGILERLANGPATIGQLAAPFSLTLNGVKKHVGILEEVDLVTTSKVGRSRECRLGPAELDDVTCWIDSYQRVLERRLDSFGAYVEARTANSR